MTIAKLLNLDLCPRLYSLRDRHLHVPRRFEVPAAIGGIVQHDVSLEPIQRVAATIDEGWRSATDVLERFGSAARGDRIYQAGHALGQLLRTVLPVRLLCAARLSQAPVPRPRTRRVRPCSAATNLHSAATGQARSTHRLLAGHETLPIAQEGLRVAMDRVPPL